MTAKQLITTLGAVLLLNSCHDKVEYDTLKRDIQEDIATFDPQIANDNSSAIAINDMFEGLITFDQQQNLIPGYAESWTISTDKKTYTFHLRDNIKFSDGSSITANDFVYSFRRLVDPVTNANYNYLLANVVGGQDVIAGKLPLEALGVIALDNKTVEIKLSNPDNNFLAILAMPNLSVVKQATIEKYKEKWTKPENMVSSGAYKLVDYIALNEVTEEKNPNYYDADKVKINRVMLFPISDRSSSLSQYKTGEIDMTHSLPSDQVKAIKKEYIKTGQYRDVATEANVYYDFNLKNPLFKNIKLRQALNLAVDRNVLTTKVIQVQPAPLYSIITPTIENGTYKDINYNWKTLSNNARIAKARELYKQAGFDKNKPLTIHILYPSKDMKIPLAIASMWKQVLGINVIIDPQEWKIFLTSRVKGDFQIAFDSWVADYNAVDTYAELFMCNNEQNHSGYCNADYDKLINQAKLAVNPKDRIRLMKQAITILNNDYPAIPLYQSSFSRLVSPRVLNYDNKNNHFDRIKSQWLELKD